VDLYLIISDIDTPATAATSASIIRSVACQKEHTARLLENEALCTRARTVKEYGRLIRLYCLRSDYTIFC
jgi:hypothetical protein